MTTRTLRSVAQTTAATAATTIIALVAIVPNTRTPTRSSPFTNMPSVDPFAWCAPYNFQLEVDNVAAYDTVARRWILDRTRLCAEVERLRDFLTYAQQKALDTALIELVVAVLINDGWSDYERKHGYMHKGVFVEQPGLRGSLLFVSVHYPWPAR